ncbi:MAG: DUF4446 family protein [Acidimicrobiia bacterium]|nr:DUF4446 family protein [Acidimicrobiia bacterium]
MDAATVAAIIATIALFVALGLALQIAALRRRLAAVPKDGNVIDLMRSIDGDLAKVEAVVTNIEPRLQSVEQRLPLAISFTGVVTYDAFGDIGGKLSRSIALLDSNGDGLVISLLVGRNETLFFTKEVRSGSGTERLSPEEGAAIQRAMGH